jgi:hypothetical protein
MLTLGTDHKDEHKQTDTNYVHHFGVQLEERHSGYYAVARWPAFATMTSEEVAIRRLEVSDFTIDPVTADELRQRFQRLRELERAVNATSPRCLYEGQWAILGLIARGYQLSLCCIEMLAHGNWNGFYAGARGLLEAICAASWVLENVKRLPSLVRQEPVKAGKMLNAGYAKWPDLKGVYGDLSAIVHPARDGHVLGFNRAALEGDGVMTSFSMGFSDSSFSLKLNTLRTLLLRFVEEIGGLAALREDAIRVGRVMAELRPSTES